MNGGYPWRSRRSPIGPDVPLVGHFGRWPHDYNVIGAAKPSVRCPKKLDVRNEPQGVSRFSPLQPLNTTVHLAERLLLKECQRASHDVDSEQQERDKENLSKPLLGQSISNTLTQYHPDYCGKYGTGGKNAVLDS